MAPLSRLTVVISNNRIPSDQLLRQASLGLARGCARRHSRTKACRRYRRNVILIHHRIRLAPPEAFKVYSVRPKRSHRSNHKWRVRVMNLPRVQISHLLSLTSRLGELWLLKTMERDLKVPKIWLMNDLSRVKFSQGCKMVALNLPFLWELAPTRRRYSVLSKPTGSNTGTRKPTSLLKTKTN